MLNVLLIENGPKSVAEPFLNAFHKQFPERLPNWYGGSVSVNVLPAAQPCFLVQRISP